MSGTRLGHGLSAREQQIMDLSDAGRSASQIAAELKLRPIYIRQVVNKYAFGSCWNTSIRAERNIRAADRRYAAALAATGKRYA